MRSHLAAALGLAIISALAAVTAASVSEDIVKQEWEVGGGRGAWNVVTHGIVSGLEGGAWEAVRGGESGGDVQDEGLDG